MKTTYVAVVRPSKESLAILQAGVATIARATRQTFSWLFQKKLDPALVKRSVCAEFGLLARHWSGCRSAALAAVNGWREGRLEELLSNRLRLAGLEERWSKDRVTPERKRRNAVARRKCAVRIGRLEKELQGTPRHCFGGRKLLRRGRLAEWRRRRDSEALFCGESGRVAGNQVAQWIAGVLMLRMPVGAGALRVRIPDVRFNLGQEARLVEVVNRRSPVTWRVKLLPRGKVQLCVTFEETVPESTTCLASGVVGVDLNAAHVAGAKVSAGGRVAGAKTFALPKQSDGVQKVARALVDWAQETGAPLVVEDLDFRKKKTWLKSYGKRFAEILSQFRSRAFRNALVRRALRCGVAVCFVDPAWTTRLGVLKYECRWRLGRHHAAAVVIGRRGLGFGERLPKTVPWTFRYTVECRDTFGSRGRSCRGCRSHGGRLVGLASEIVLVVKPRKAA